MSAAVAIGGPVMSDEIIIPAALRALNRQRCDRWHPPTGDDWTLGDWSNAFMGEAGELANVVKKLRRHQSGHATSCNTPEVEELRESFAEEVADVLLYLDLLCWKAGVEPDDLYRELIWKFNHVSKLQGWDDLTIARDSEDSEESAGTRIHDAV